MYEFLDLTKSTNLAKQNLLDLITQLTSEQINYLQQLSTKLRLELIANKLYLTSQTQNFKPFNLNYNFLLEKQSINTSLVAKACKISKDTKVADLTCGWGYDSAVLAHQGGCVVSYEANPLIGLMVQYTILELNYNWKVIIADSTTKLNTLNKYQVIYLDPMFNPLDKTRKSNKQIQIITNTQQINTDAETFLNLLINKFTNKVVIKLYKNSQLKSKPNYIISGKNIKFWVYLK